MLALIAVVRLNTTALFQRKGMARTTNEYADHVTRVLFTAMVHLYQTQVSDPAIRPGVAEAL